jgi:hypothetical protein
MTATMNAEQAERRFHELQKLRQRAALDDGAFRVEVAKLLWRDVHGVFWMPDPETGAWFCNDGNGWIPGDPHAEPHLQAAQPGWRRDRPRRLWRRTRRLLLATALLVALAGLAIVLVFWLHPPAKDSLAALTPTEPLRVQVSIASPAEGSQVAIGQVVAIEATIVGAPSLWGVARVEFQANGELVAAQPVQPKIQIGQASLPVSQAWRPAALGQYQVTVTAYSSQDEPLGTAGLSLAVVELASEPAPAAGCSPAATFVADVTIPAGTAFPPGARMDKVWQVRNSGTCAWGVGYELVLVAGDDLGAPHSVPVPPTAAEELADLAITFWAPTVTVPFTSVWQLQAPDGQFFGPTLPLSIAVEVQAVENLPPLPPAVLQATVIGGSNAGDGNAAGDGYAVDDEYAVRLTWEDQSDNEAAFRIYREDVEASIGLAPANAVQFVDEGVTCGHTYYYAVIAFNAAGVSELSQEAVATLPPCASLADTPPTLILTVVPTDIVASGTFTVVFQANDDLGLSRVTIQGQASGDPLIDAGRSFTCTTPVCAGAWPLTWTGDVSAPLTLTLTAVTWDSAGQESEPAHTTVTVRPPE